MCNAARLKLRREGERLAHAEADVCSPLGKVLGFEVNWTNTIVVLGPVLLSLYGLWTTPIHLYTALLAAFWYYLTGMGVTMGYHKLWAHRAYKACEPLQWVLAVFGAGSYQGSAKWWCLQHRIHHRYIDTPKDPYDATRGFWYTHIGWMIMKQDYAKLGRTDVSDLRQNRVIRIQHQYYLPLAFGFGVLLPWAICGLAWGDWRGGFYYAAFLRIVCLHNSTFFINSLAHSPILGGKQVYSDKNSTYDSAFTALLTLGEGYHNFHHEFPTDYRNGVRFYHFDPTKWTIRACAALGLASDLTRVPNNEMQRGIAQMREKELKKHLSKVDLGPKASDLPSWDWAEIEGRCKAGAKLVVVDGFVIDLLLEFDIGAGISYPNSTSNWYDFHPGGKPMLDAYIGKDATTAFHGEVYNHSQSGLNMVERLRVANVQGYREEGLKEE